MFNVFGYFISIYFRRISYMVVYIYQTDNRPSLSYLQQTMKVNKYYARMNKYNYIFEEMKIEGNFHPALYKIMMVNKFYQHIFLKKMIF